MWFHQVVVRLLVARSFSTPVSTARFYKRGRGDVSLLSAFRGTFTLPCKVSLIFTCLLHLCFYILRIKMTCRVYCLILHLYSLLIESCWHGSFKRSRNKIGSIDEKLIQYSLSRFLVSARLFQVLNFQYFCFKMRKESITVLPIKTGEAGKQSRTEHLTYCQVNI